MKKIAQDSTNSKRKLHFIHKMKLNQKMVRKERIFTSQAIPIRKKLKTRKQSLWKHLRVCFTLTEKSPKVTVTKVLRNKNKRSNNKFAPPTPTLTKLSVSHLLRKSKSNLSSNRQLYRIQPEPHSVPQTNSLNSSTTTIRLAKEALTPPHPRPRSSSLSHYRPKKRWTNTFSRILQ